MKDVGYQLAQELNQISDIQASGTQADSPLMEQKIQDARPESAEPAPALEEVLEATEQVQPVKPNPQQSFAEIRKLKEKAERERDELAAYVAQMQQQQKIQAETPDDGLEIDPDDVVVGKHVKKLQKELNRLQEQIKTYHAQSAEQSAEAKLKATYPDFDTVVTADNVNLLREMHPDLAATLNSSQDLYVKAASAYKLIKQFGIGAEDPYAQDKALAKKNAAKPRPTASISPQAGDSPLSHANAFANGLTPDLQKQLLKEMQAARKGL